MEKKMPTNFLRFTPIGLTHLMPDPVTGSTTVSSESSFENVNESSSCQPPRRSELDQSIQRTDSSQLSLSDDMIWPQAALNRQGGLRRQLSLPRESVLIFVYSPQFRQNRSRNDLARVGAELRQMANSFERNSNESLTWMEIIAALSEQHILLLIVPNLFGIRFIKARYNFCRFQNLENATFYPHFLNVISRNCLLTFTTVDIFIRYLRARQRRSRISFINGNEESITPYSRMQFWKEVFIMLLLNIPILIQLFDCRNQ
ncbi:uncharacterized protein LOC118189457 [Stegodyphus dumicola]|uniref:uncharacterized protein LOC118189457 n=1 Tax=Stegodyphus dumicola TaxID=202533 RepID=UPI0015AC9648|nr:uncharacterized protein LOC118189457 [Stegodyphus dumicola]